MQPTETEVRRYCEAVWGATRRPDVVLIKTMLYTDIKVAQLVRIRLDDVDLDRCRIRVRAGNESSRFVSFSGSFREALARHVDAQREKGASFLFESSWKKPYSTRGVRALLAATPRRQGLSRTSLPTVSSPFWCPGYGPRAWTTPTHSPFSSWPPPQAKESYERMTRGGRTLSAAKTSGFRKGPTER